MRVLLLTRYGSLGASSRLRMLQYVPELARVGVDCASQALIDDDVLRSKYETGRYSMSDMVQAYSRRWRFLKSNGPWDLVWVEKEVFPWFPGSMDVRSMRGNRWALDFDDAVFHTYDMHRNVLVRRSLGTRVDRAMHSANMTIAGNEYLAERARRAGSRHVRIIPTVVDVSRYVPAGRDAAERTFTRLVWIGSPSTARYLDTVRGAIEAVGRRTDLKLRVIGAAIEPMNGVPTECLPWTLDSEAMNLSDSDIGLMPLLDSPWERGKCAYKLVQYMASGLPTVASAVGANCQVVREGVTGFLARGEKDWIEHLLVLAQDRMLRHRMGALGRAVAEREFSLGATVPVLVEALRAAASAN